MPKWARWVGFIFDIANIWQWITPSILAGLAVVVSLITHAPPIFYYTILGVFALYIIGKVANDYFKWKRWDKIQIEEDKILSNILKTLKKIHYYISKKAKELAKDKDNIEGIDSMESTLLNEWNINTDKIIAKIKTNNTDNIINNLEKQARKQLKSTLKNKDKTLSRITDIDISLKNNLFNSLSNDTNYNKLKSQLDDYRFSLAISNEQISDIIDKIIDFSIGIQSGMVYQKIKLDKGLMLGEKDKFKIKYNRLERQIEPRFNKELENVRKRIRREIMRGI